MSERTNNQSQEICKKTNFSCDVPLHHNKLIKTVNCKQRLLHICDHYVNVGYSTLSVHSGVNIAIQKPCSINELNQIRARADAFYHLLFKQT